MDEISTGDEVQVDTEAGTLTNTTTGKSYTLQPLGDVGDIIRAGGVFEYARQSGII